MQSTPQLPRRLQRAPRRHRSHNGLPWAVSQRLNNRQPSFKDGKWEGSVEYSPAPGLLDKLQRKLKVPVGGCEIAGIVGSFALVAEWHLMPWEKVEQVLATDESLRLHHDRWPQGISKFMFVYTYKCKQHKK